MWIAKCGSSLYRASQAQLTVHQLTLFIIRWYFWMALKHCAIIVRAFLKVWYSLQCCDRDIKFIITSNSTCTVVFQLPVFHTCTWQLSDNFYLENNSFKKKNFLQSLGQKKKIPLLIILLYLSFLHMLVFLADFTSCIMQLLWLLIVRAFFWRIW